MVTATGFGLGYSIAIQNNTLVINYGPLFALDVIALFIRVYYAHHNRAHNMRALPLSLSLTNLANDIENPIHDILE
jgi:hypothetical protein